MPTDTTALLASIDQTLASARAALAAGDDAEQTADARTQLSARAGADLARLLVSVEKLAGGVVTDAAAQHLRRAEQAARDGDLRAAERQLTAAREQIGGRSA